MEKSTFSPSHCLNLEQGAVGVSTVIGHHFDVMRDCRGARTELLLMDVVVKAQSVRR